MVEQVVKKARKVKDASADSWPEEAWGDDAAKPPRKKAAVTAAEVPELAAELEQGAVVLYYLPGQTEGWRGIIRDNFDPLDEFWIADEETGDVVRDENGDIYHFKASELELVAGPPIAPPNPKEGSPGGVLIIGNEQQMMKILNHFGTPETSERRQPQALLALPCKDCEPDRILPLVAEGVEADVRELARELRPDIHVAVRAFHVKQAMQELGPDLQRMDDFYVLSAVTLPYSWEDIEVAKAWKKKWRRDVCNQIDVGPTARGLHEDADLTPEETARRALGNELGVEVALELWDEEVQTNIRQLLEIELPLKVTDVNDGRISVVVLPSDALVAIVDSVVVFSAPHDAEYLAEGAVEASPEAEDTGGIAEASPDTDENNAPAAAAAAHGGKTIAQWEREQSQFSHLPKLPLDWVRVISQKSGDVYFFNKKTQQATFDLPEVPLPPGWTKQVSKSTGKAYFFHAGRKKSQFDRPTESS